MKKKKKRSTRQPGQDDIVGEVAVKQKTRKKGLSRPPGTASRRGMFSAASFADVLAHQATDERIEEPDLRPVRPAVIAFYGFRGGAGRTTALAHVAVLLASQQRNVVVVDLDLEAPGIDRVLGAPRPEPGKGVVALIRTALSASEPDGVVLTPHLVAVAMSGASLIRILPAGILDSAYIQALDDLGVPLWHALEGPSPLQALLESIESELEPDAILIDCRTGLTGLAASAMFHFADQVVCFLPMSEQSGDGLDVFLKTVRAAREQRDGRPDIVLVPSMVPDGPEARAKLSNWFVPLLEGRYVELVRGISAGEEDYEDARETAPIVREGIAYRAGIALADKIKEDYFPRAAGEYQPLMHRLEPLLVGHEGPKSVHEIKVETRKVLDELGGDLDRLAFAEHTPVQELVRMFLPPQDFEALLDRSTTYVTGAKGAGKTWMWRYLLSPEFRGRARDMIYLPGHEPDATEQDLETRFGGLRLSPSAFREIEKQAKMLRGATHPAFWIMSALARLGREFPVVQQAALAVCSGPERRHVRRLFETSDRAFHDALTQALLLDRAGTLAEEALKAADTALLQSSVPGVTLLYDGLEVAFGGDEELQKRFVRGLVGAAEVLRGRLKRLFFKIFLREDIYFNLELQNQSHLSAATQEVRWEPRDVLSLVLRIALHSRSYQSALKRAGHDVAPEKLPADTETLEKLLEPFWGKQLEGGNKVRTTVFIQRRTADGKGRMFPRTLVQLVAAAVEHERTMADYRPDRVLRSASLQQGYRRASEQRVADLKKEYAWLQRYLYGLREMTPTGTLLEIRKRVAPAMLNAGKAAAPATLHKGRGGWQKVVDMLMEIGVLKEYMRARGEYGEKKYEVALLYRPGLGVKSPGV
jgi:MinD-like ATPase involved in chromosome partitioning or flagellar assembly